MVERETVLRRKLAARATPEPSPSEAGARLWRTAFPRAAREEIGLDLSCASLRDERLSLTELLDCIPQQALNAVLEGPETALGLLAMSPALTAAVIEAQTMGRLGPVAPPARRPTRTDAAMCAGLVDRAMAALELSLANEADLTWAGGFRYASFLEEARALGLLLDDIPYRCLTAEIEIEGGARSGELILALPAEGRGPRPVTASQPGRALIEQNQWQLALSGAVLEAEVVVEALLGRILLPLGAARALEAGAVLPLTGARTDAVTLRVSGSLGLPPARLGQQRGMRALKITLSDEAWSETVRAFASASASPPPSAVSPAAPRGSGAAASGAAAPSSGPPPTASPPLQSDEPEAPPKDD